MNTIPGAQSQHGSSGWSYSCSPTEAAASAPRGWAQPGQGDKDGSGMGCGSLASKGQGKSGVGAAPCTKGGQCCISSACGGEEQWEGLVGPASPQLPGLQRCGSVGGSGHGFQFPQFPRWTCWGCPCKILQ